MVGADVARQLEERSIALYVEGARRAEAVGLILADTKFEFGWIDGELAVIDEVLTPDSSRFWDGERYAPGSSPQSFDKQFVRDFVAGVRLGQGAAGADAPRRGHPRHARPVRGGVRAAHRTSVGSVGLTVRWLAEVHVALRAGIADPEGLTVASALRSLGYASVSDVRSGKLLRMVFEAEDRDAAEAALGDMCRRLLANPVMEVATWDLAPEAEPARVEMPG